MAQKRKSESPTSSSSKPSKKVFWNQGLKASMEDPELKVDSDDEVVVIKDKYPKARYHFLVLPKRNIPNLKSLKKEDLKLLKHMHAKGLEVAENCSRCGQFKLGYHAVPSMSHLHLHVISQDFDSPCLKTKKHWNSFTSEYFIDSNSIMKQLETSGKVITMSSAEAEACLKRPLRCHECDSEFPTMPKLKTHILKHCS